MLFLLTCSCTGLGSCVFYIVLHIYVVCLAVCCCFPLWVPTLCEWRHWLFRLFSFRRCAGPRGNKLHRFFRLPVCPRWCWTGCRLRGSRGGRPSWPGAVLAWFTARWASCMYGYASPVGSAPPAWYTARIVSRRGATVGWTTTGEASVFGCVQNGGVHPPTLCVGA